jgi:predicted nucleic acid-binding protein
VLPSASAISWSNGAVVDTLIDAGPLLATINRNDQRHLECAALLRRLDCPFYTTLAVITEAMYLLGRYTGAAGQSALWRMILRGDLILEHPTHHDLRRMADLMDRYADRPMDFADASLTAGAGAHRDHRPNRLLDLSFARSEAVRHRRSVSAAARCGAWACGSARKLSRHRARGRRRSGAPAPRGCPRRRLKKTEWSGEDGSSVVTSTSTDGPAVRADAAPYCAVTR